MSLYDESLAVVRAAAAARGLRWERIAGGWTATGANGRVYRVELAAYRGPAQRSARVWVFGLRGGPIETELPGATLAKLWAAAFETGCHVTEEE